MDMSNPPSNPLDDSNARHRHLGDWLVDGSLYLRRKICHTDWTSPQQAPSTSSVDQDSLELKEVLYNRIHSYILPLLHHQLTTLSLLLDGLPTEPESVMKQMLQIQPEIDYNLTQMKAAIDVICPDSLSYQADDQQLKQFKIYRLVELRKMLRQLETPYTCSVLNAASEHIDAMGFSTTSRFENGEAYTYRHATLHTLDWIGRTVTHLTGSELDVAGNTWRDSMLSIDQELDNIVNMFKSTPHSPDHRGTHRRNLVASCISLLLDFFSEADATDGAPANPANSENIIVIVETVATSFVTPMDLVVDYLVPLVPETGGLPNQNYYKDWLVTWDTQLLLAIHNCIQCAANI
ncbi:hypothetical protein PtA15_6A344 [Puccinia triticina]|uniref:Uncharacterized protein n=1 Tax=Puccinia triticina TaxID=208348 RepID=A0ABY7CPK1_9BASI|nr:uncharacterized protein PtA15_6A344 [Puccinia triticina]WAQ85715.1 hypothetical protein PtA15_6A344 [Puccinia triticina]